MCHERWMMSRREGAREEGRRVWDLFDRETTAEPPRPVSADERTAEPERRESPDRETAGTPG